MKTIVTISSFFISFSYKTLLKNLLILAFSIAFTFVLMYIVSKHMFVKDESLVKEVKYHQTSSIIIKKQ